MCVNKYIQTEREKGKGSEREKSIIDKVNGGNMLTIGNIRAAFLNV